MKIWRAKIRNTIVKCELAFCVWFGLSFLEIVTKNLTAHPEYSPLNMIKLFI